MSHAVRFRAYSLANARSVHARSNFVVAITFPRLLGAFKPQGAFGWYAGWNIVGFFAILLFVPETKALSLEELDQGEYRFFFPEPPTAAWPCLLIIVYARPLTQPYSIFGADDHPCCVSDQGAAA
jgi:hypothetical protein